MWRLFEVTGKRKAPVVEQLQNPVQEDSVRQVWRSKGKAHSLAIVRGIAAIQVKQEAARLKASVDLQGHQLASVVFSDTGRAQNSAALRKVCLVFIGFGVDYYYYYYSYCYCHCYYCCYDYGTDCTTMTMTLTIRLYCHCHC